MADFRQLSMEEALDAEHAYVRRDAKATSVLAALATLPRSRTRRYAVLEAIAGAGGQGLTDEELLIAVAPVPNTIRPRRVELVDGGWIEDSGQRRPTRSGADAIVWVLTEEGAARWRARAAS